MADPIPRKFERKLSHFISEFLHLGGIGLGAMPSNVQFVIAPSGKVRLLDSSGADTIGCYSTVDDESTIDCS